MDATTTHSISWLVEKLKNAHPTLNFKEDDYFLWSPSSRTIHYTTKNIDTTSAFLLLLHELSHALLDHHSYTRDVELVAMESAAWEKALQYLEENQKMWLEMPGLTDSTTSAAPTALVISASASATDKIIQDHLDTYRDWLHARATCPVCSASGYQTAQRAYTCPACNHKWLVNEARVCALRRYSASK